MSDFLNRLFAYLTHPLAGESQSLTGFLEPFLLTSNAEATRNHLLLTWFQYFLKDAL